MNNTTSIVSDHAIANLSTDIQAPTDTVILSSATEEHVLSDTTMHGLDEILSRPVLVKTFSWSTNEEVIPLTLNRAQYDAGTTQKLRLNFPQDIMNNSAIIKQKLQNFLFFRSDLHVTLKINANQFQQGSLLLVYNPYAGETSRFRDEGSHYLASQTSYVVQILDLAIKNSVDLEIPYANVYDMFNTSNADDQFGTLSLFVLSTLRGQADVETVTGNIIARFVNPVYRTPTGLPPPEAIQSADEAQTEINRLKAKFSLDKMKAQIGEGDVQGPVSKIADVVADVSEKMSGIPVISFVATTVSWLARMVSGVASIFGWSKPGDHVMPIAVVPIPGKYMANTEGKDYSQNLGMICDNAVDLTDMIPSTNDEMTLKLLTSHPNMFARKDVTATQFSNRQKILSWMVSPFNAHSQNITDVGRGLSLGSFAFTSLLFRKWRGSIVYKVRVIKTAFHQGRFVMVYFPNTSILDQPPTLGEAISSGYNNICDLNIKNDGAVVEYEFPIPFVANQAWKRTMLRDTDGFPNSLTQVTANGSVGMYSLNDLIHPDSVSDTVTFLVSYHGGPDYQLAIPTLTLAGGFPELGSVPNISQRVADALNGLNSSFFSDYDIGDFPNLVDVQTGTLQVGQSTPTATYPILEGLELTVPDGEYPASLTVTWNNGILAPIQYVLNVTVTDNHVTNATCTDRFECLTAATMLDSVIWTVTVTTFQAQVGPSVSNQLIPSVKSYNAFKETIGEYCLSLRALIKRFGLSRQMRQADPFSHNIVEFASYEPPDEDTPREGYRYTIYDRITNAGFFIPETWFSLSSYLYRFYGGGTRVKVFGDSGAQMRGSLVFDDIKNMSFTSTDPGPVVEQLSDVNNALEITIPYYSEVRARCVGGPWTVEGPQVRLELYNTTNILEPSAPVPVYEAAADDFSFFFKIGPPVMHLAANDPIAAPLMQPPASIERNHKFRKTQ